MHGLSRRGVGRRSRQISDSLTDHHLRPLSVQSHDSWPGEHHRVCHLVKRPDEDRSVTGDEADHEVGFATLGVTWRRLRSPGRGAVGVDWRRGPRRSLREWAAATKQVRDRPQGRDELCDVEISHDREVDAEGILFDHGDARDGRIDHDLPRRGVDLCDEFGDAFEAVRVVVDHENRGLRPVVPTHVAQIPLDASRNLADETELAALRKQRGGEFTRVTSGEMFELEHSTLGLAIERLHSGELLLRVDEDEFPFLDPSESVGLQNGVEGLLERDVEEVRSDHRRDIPARDDIALALQGEHLKNLRQVRVLHLNVERVEVVDFDTAQVKTFCCGGRGAVLAESVRKDGDASQGEDAQREPDSADGSIEE